MKFTAGVFALIALCTVVGAYGLPHEGAQGIAQEEAALVVQTEGEVLPWENPFLRLTAADGLPQEPGEPTEPQIIPNVWCCKPDGNCAKIKQTKCASIGGVQHRTEAACYNDPNC